MRGLLNRFPYGMQIAARALLKPSPHKLLSEWPASAEYGDDELAQRRMVAAQGIIDTSAYDASNGLGILQLLLDGLPDPVSIVDFGGGFGLHGLALQHFNPTRQIAYTVIETPTTVAAANRLRTPSPVSYTTDFPPRATVFFTSGAIQYVHHWQEPVERGFATAERFAVFSRNSFSEDRIIRLQRDEAGASYPHGTVSKRQLIDIGIAAGFAVYAEFDSLSGALMYEDRVSGGDLVFMRRCAHDHLGIRA